MAKEIIITDACNRHKFICFNLNGLEDGVLVVRSKDNVSINFGLNHHYEKCHLNIYVPSEAFNKYKISYLT